MHKAMFLACALFILYIGYKVPQGFAEGTVEANCTAIIKKDSCCNATLNGSCIFLNCTEKDDKLHEACHDKNFNTSEVCKIHTESNTCAPSPTTLTTTATPTPDSCQQNTNMTTCCATAGCMYLSCPKPSPATGNFTGCLNSAEKSKECNSSDVPNMCDSLTTTKIPTTSAEKGTTTTTKTETTAPKTTTEAMKSTSSGQSDDSPKQHFDAASFIGGIVLCLGIVAIIFFGCKFYKARTERNYHTL